MADRSHNYELAYHINPDTDEASLTAARQHLERDLNGIGAVITFTKEPEKTRLSYPIGHSQSSFFGYFNFTLQNGEGLNSLDGQIKLMPEVMRYLILKLPANAPKSKTQTRQYRPHDRLNKKPVPKATEQETKEMEKQLEDVIEKL